MRTNEDRARALAELTENARSMTFDQLVEHVATLSLASEEMSITMQMLTAHCARQMDDIQQADQRTQHAHRLLQETREAIDEWVMGTRGRSLELEQLSAIKASSARIQSLVTLAMAALEERKAAAASEQGRAHAKGQWEHAVEQRQWWVTRWQERKAADPTAKKRAFVRAHWKQYENAFAHPAATVPETVWDSYLKGQ